MVREPYSSDMEVGMNMMNNDMNMKPAWLEGLMAETFFGACGAHDNLRKNEKNVFCLHCCLSICPHCFPSHRSHPLLQPYTINSAKVIFLNQRPQSRSFKGSANICWTCDRILQEPFHFCSLSCKVDNMVCQGEDLSSILYRFDESDFAISQFEGLQMDGSEMIIDDDDGQITTSSILEDPELQYRGSSCSNEATSNSLISSEPELVKKKNKGRGLLPGIVLSLSSRRKGAPQRAPLS
ncbi:protein RGF1 INDUCIBLE TRANSCRIPTION FACTOR 1-like isoform X2 [Juglans microcarpa x Juglans regia]|uniref:protein RGF1 INDUCIBLE TRANSCRIPTION FACTOR 1-like isoform X2 n=1 Tax=Juglans microcarpa x Juglans regia TaxID=2249226 RepID=UPI001B7F4B5A|nr:protein RGF1 INDUCIBLE TRANSCRIPTION FACTOR 1-like isoform X2 [Juglans microcarpa x Juglans regia]